MDSGARTQISAAYAPQSAPLVSIIVLNYNGAASIVQCLESIRTQTYSPIETIVVDNCSSDDSMALVEKLFPSFKTIYNSSNLGFAEGNNVGIRRSNGDYVVLANNDLFLEPDAISNMVRRMSPKVGILGGLVYYYDSPQNVWAYGGYFEPITGMHWQGFQGSPHDTKLPTRSTVDYVPGALFMIRSSVLRRIGLLDSHYFLYGDDIDLACKVKRIGYTVEVSSSIVSYHKVSQSIRAVDKVHELRGFYLMNKHQFYLCFVQLPLSFAITSTISQLAFSFAEIFIFKRKRSYFAVRVRALVDTLRNPKSIITKRAELRAIGKLSLRPNLIQLLKIARSRSTSRTYYW